MDLAKYIAEREEIIASTERRGKLSSEDKEFLELVRRKMQKYLCEIDKLFERFLD
jgi:hypothetical protein